MSFSNCSLELRILLENAAALDAISKNSYDFVVDSRSFPLSNNRYSSRNSPKNRWVLDKNSRILELTLTEEVQHNSVRSLPI